MRFKLILFSLVMFTLLNACRQTIKIEKKPLLLADREASIGWVILNIFADSTFQYTSGGARNITDYTGYVQIQNDTLYFQYKDSIPVVGKIAIIKNNYVVYIAGTYREHLEIKFNDLK
jgi:hypothetical protein